MPTPSSFRHSNSRIKLTTTEMVTKTTTTLMKMRSTWETIVAAMTRRMTMTSEHPVCLFFAVFCCSVYCQSCVPFVFDFGISISVATTHFLTGFGSNSSL